MLKNNNQAITRKISKRFMHKNKMRNRITILAIILMTFMFTTVFSIGFSMAKNMNTMLIRQAGTTAEISLANPAPEQIDEIKKCSALSAAGVTIPVCKAKSEEDQDLNFKLIYHDKENFNGNIKPALSSLKGNYPDEKNEIMLSVSGLNAIGIKSPEIGMDIPLMLKNEEQIFKLSGYFVDYGFRTNNYDAFVSEKFSDSLGLTAEQDGLISISSKSFLQNILYDQLYESVKLNQGQEFECTFDNNENNGIVIAAAVLFICLIIIISGYLLIYNIVYISVNHDIRFYGLLKTIGTTSKQIRSIVKYQSLSLSVIGIPIGILIGTIVSFKAIPYSISMFGGDFYSAMPTDISFNPLIYMGTILFALLTILISCRKPAKFAGSISPIEMEGKTITLINEKTGRKKDIKVGVCASSDDNALLEIGYYWCTVGAPEYVLVSQSVINELSDSPHVETIIANCSPENEESVRMQIKQLTQHNISIPSVAHIQIKSEELEEFRSSILSMRIMTSGICAILILIGIINFINVMLTGIFTRRNELAVMESIGMTKKQVRKMLIFEGFYYALITDSLILTLGSGIVYIFGKLSLKIADYAIFSYPWQLIICISLIILIICILVPAAVYRIVAKNSVTDRLRSTE